MHSFEDYTLFADYQIVDDVDSINESAQSEVAESKGAILAIVKGPHFCPGKVSRNRRLYTHELWASVKNDVDFATRLKTNQVIGRIGHEAEMTDMDIAKGEFSHYTRNIDWDTGFAESVIVNTAMGNTLLTMLRAKMVMYVSSRADGDYSGKDEDGNDILDPKTFTLERFDFVRDPGFLDAKPKMVTEALDKAKDMDPEKAAQLLLQLAYKGQVPLNLDGQIYTVNSCDADGKVLMTSKGSSDSESYSLSDFTEALDELQQSIVDCCKDCQARVDVAESDLKALRFANKEGLNESYVLEKLKAGLTLDEIKRASTVADTQFRIVGCKPMQEALKQENSFLGHLFG